MKNRNFGLALFIVPWLIILCVPTLRLMLRVQVQGSDLMTEYSSDGNSSAATRAERLHQQLAARYPNDTRVQGRNLEASYHASISVAPRPFSQAPDGTVLKQQTLSFKQAISDYDALIHRFPGQAWLIANRVRFTTRQPLNNRVAEGLQTPPTASLPPTPMAFMPSELEQTIAIAQQGQRLEPDNSFYDWIIAQCLYGLRRDDEALAVLHQAAAKPHYDAHLEDDLQAEIATRQLARPLLSEEKLMVMAGELLPHYAGHRQTARLAVAAGVRAERAGDHQQALTIYYDVARLGAVIRKDDYFLIGRLVGIAIQSTAWSGKTRQETPAEKSQYNNRSNDMGQLAARKFALYATSHGRPDIAAATQREAQAMAQFQQLVTPALAGDTTIFGIPRRTFNTLSNLWWASANLLPQLLLNMALWLGLSLILRYRLAPRREAVSWLDVTSLLITCSCVTIALMMLGLVLGAGWNQIQITGVHPDAQELIALVSKLLIVAPAVLGAMLCGCGVLWRKRLHGRHSSVAYGLDCYRKMLGAFVTMTGIAYLLLLAASLPVRHTINARLDIGIQQGEMALLKRSSKP